MRRPDKAGGKAAKTQRRRASKHRSAPKIADRRISPVYNMDTDVARLTRERDEALERQTATAEILGAMSGSPTDTQPVFDAIVQSGLKLFPGAATIGQSGHELLHCTCPLFDRLGRPPSFA